MPATPFRADVREAPGEAVIAVSGDITMAAETALLEAWSAAKSLAPPTIVLDFSDVGYINSTGIALIVGLLADARRSGRTVTARALSPHYAEIFRITRLSDFLHIEEVEAAAMTGTAVGGTR